MWQGISVQKGSNLLYWQINSFFTNNDIKFSSSDIAETISHVDPNKVPGHDMLSIRMITLWKFKNFKPLSIIFNDCLNKGKFSHDWKNANVVPVRKRGWKAIGQTLYSLFVAKFLNVSFITKCLTFFTENNLISPNQWGFRSGDSCVNQLLPITHEIYKSFDDSFEVRRAFLDIFKPFDKVWHESLLLKVNWNGITGKSFETFTRFSFLPKPKCSSKRSALILG